MEKLKLATRSSPLALWQARHVADLLEATGISTEILPIETSGDKKLDVSLSKIGEKGLFTQELEQLLLEGKAHLAVHSAKDMPSRLPAGLELIAFSQREDPSDVLVSFHSELNLYEPGLRVGTSSTRRVAMLKRYVPEAETVSVRGNLQTRFRKMKEGACDAMLLARVGVMRMGFHEHIRETLPLHPFTPAAGQASLAVEITENLPESMKKAIRSAVNHQETEWALSAERSFLKKMEGGCSIPVFALCMPTGNSVYRLEAGIISLDGKDEVRKSMEIYASGQNDFVQYFSDAGEQLAKEVLLAGGTFILDKIKANCD